MPKGDNDIRIVHDRTSGGMNGAVWAPPFLLPTSNTLMRLLESSTCQLNMDIREMFLNFPLDYRAWKFCGINLLDFDGLRLADHKRNHIAWTTLWMDFVPRPACSVSYLGLAQENSQRGSFIP